ncbi:phosphatase PAP2 family protein [Streptomyces somaliensis DSM 40738]|uniref:Phosphatase PAP2 family protein n=1 Tax=Streptomyces somaliensis (strain ATCC 33201 / DSM 40738 / JCM 12659 / KCTC 9044 / NCTC 11332 / NRRL B-12077 / IP 733) TaxID=1134445 RepID=A0AA44IBW4_STRE0|nr:phosphatase PAP2 family protein [Streptomyces somaliensis]MCQ0023384.1 phosphatase PAP2 family protein [Streptomyces somaliensis DSM 40738]NKY12787.1 phosphatase PAP2 family protein [Streptomyces somaliensis DSM 40738]
MPGLASDGTNPDVGLLYDINGLAKAAPGWFDRLMGFVGEYGIMLGLVLVVLWCWWSARRRGTPEDSVCAAAGIVWAPLAAVIALLVNIPIRDFVERPRPFLDHAGLEVLVRGKTDFSFVSDHSTMAMAVAVGLFIADRRFGLAAIVLALAEGFCRVYVGVHYPTDAIGGFALGTAVALLLAPVALALLTPLTSALARSPRTRRLVRSRKAPRGGPRHETVTLADPRRGASGDGERGLAA